MAIQSQFIFTTTNWKNKFCLQNCLKIIYRISSQQFLIYAGLSNFNWGKQNTCLNTHTHTQIREELRFLSWLIYLLAVHQLSRPGDDIMCDISPWRCYLSVLFQPRLNPPPSRHNSIRTYRDLPPQSHPLPKCSSGKPARGAGMAICVGPVAMYSRWRFQDAACHADISWLLRTF